MLMQRHIMQGHEVEATEQAAVRHAPKAHVVANGG